MEARRWYDKDPIIKEAIDLLQISSDELKGEAAAYMLNLQNQVAQEFLDDVYEKMTQYQGKGNRWYDNDPVIMKAIELWRVAPAKIQRKVALKLLLAIEDGNFNNIED